MKREEPHHELKLNKDYYVVTANDLIKGRQKMTLREAQLLYIAIAQITKNDTDLKTYETTVPELARFMKIDEQSLYRDLKGICKSLCQQVVEVQIGGTKARQQWKIFSWIQSAEYDSGKLILRLSDDIKPYLLDLQAYYTQTQLGTLLTFRSYYATRLYQYLYADANARNTEEWTYSCEELRELFQVRPTQYKQTRDLMKKTIIPAITELNATEYAHIWNYTEHRAKKRGNPITGVSFSAVFFRRAEEKESFLTHKRIWDRQREEQQKVVKTNDRQNNT